MKKRSMRGRLAVAGGQLAGIASRGLGKGSGGMIGGKLALKMHPGVLSELSQDRKVVLITGTNGKSTTTKMVRAALGGDAVASNIHGDNMTAGITAALISQRDTEMAALEVDEMHLPSVAEQTRPVAMVLLNLSRDQLDRVGEIGSVERRLRQAVDDNPDAIVIANCDDPLIVSAAWDAPHVVWVAAGSGWGADSASFPRGGGRVQRDGDDWWIEDNPQFRRPQPSWFVRGTDLVGPNGSYPLRLRLPGQVNLANAAQAVACAVALGVDTELAISHVEQVRDVAGRYQRFDVEGRLVRLLLAKNPAGWQEALSMVDPAAENVVIGVNGQIPDGEDLSWLWDVNFEDWPRREATASGERGADLAVRLEYAGISGPHVPSVLEAIRSQEPGRVDVLLNYTSFRDLLLELRAHGYQEVGDE